MVSQASPMPEDLSRMSAASASTSKALELLQQHATQFYNSQHKIHELQERALKSPNSAAAAASNRASPKTSSAGPAPPSMGAIMAAAAASAAASRPSMAKSTPPPPTFTTASMGSISSPVTSA